jgi:hypothetical protein
VSSTQLHLLHGNSGIAFSSRAGFDGARRQSELMGVFAGGFILPATLAGNAHDSSSP